MSRGPSARARRRCVGAVAVALLTVGVSACHDRDDASPPAPTSSSACLTRSARDHTDLGHGTAVWARFCPAVPDQTVPARVPAGVLTRDVESVVHPGLSAVGHHASFGCDIGTSPHPFRVQVGFADGSVGQVDGDAAGCPEQLEDPYAFYAALVTAMGHQAAPASPVTTTGPPPCSPQVVTPRTASGTAPPPGHGAGTMLMNQVATRGQLCRYVSGGLVQTAALSADRAEALRVAVDGDVGTRAGSGLTSRHVRVPRDYAVSLVDAAGDVLSFWVIGEDHEVYVGGALHPLGAGGGQLVTLLTDPTAG